MTDRKASYSILLVFSVLLSMYACMDGSKSQSMDYRYSEASKTTPMPERNLIVSMDSLLLNANSGLLIYKGLPFTGSAIDYYNTASVKSKVSYFNGKKEGSYQKYFSDGSLSYDATYSDGRRHGKVRSWWSNGHLRSESNFIEGSAEGEQLQWYKSGAKFKKTHLVNGHEEGLQQSWRENGKIYNNYEAKNGRIFGLKRAALCFQLENEELSYAD